MKILFVPNLTVSGLILTFCENLRRLRDGRPLLALIDK
jgi:hypothetical protein